MTITEASEKEIAMIDKQLLESINQRVPFLQKEPFMMIHRCIKDDENNIIGGISATLEMWNILHIHVLWVSDLHRDKGIGSLLLHDVETIARSHNSQLSYLDTYSFQAKWFYEKQGYQVFGELENCYENHSVYFMQKKW